MHKSLETFGLYYLSRNLCGEEKSIVFSIDSVHSLINYSNSFIMDYLFFCGRQEAIDLIERRVIPADTDAVAYGTVSSDTMTSNLFVASSSSLYYNNKKLTLAAVPFSGIAANVIMHI